jgi:RimJ/RimL family protein N-acetyltransferase
MGAATFLSPLSLHGRIVRLEPLQREHAAELRDVVEDGRLYELWFTSVPRPEAVPAYIDTALDMQARGIALPFVVRRIADGKLVGCTRFCNADATHRRLEIGYTFYAASAQRSGVNTECKRLLLEHAFDALGCIAVEFRTHWHNRRSRAAIERLGAKLDGVLRHHQRLPDGTLRDTVVYSVIAPEWPAVRRNLDSLLERHGAAGESA